MRHRSCGSGGRGRETGAFITVILDDHSKVMRREHTGGHGLRGEGILARRTGLCFAESFVA
jgi:hypothetical protein